MWQERNPLGGEWWRAPGTSSCPYGHRGGPDAREPAQVGLGRIEQGSGLGERSQGFLAEGARAA